MAISGTTGSAEAMQIFSLSVCFHQNPHISTPSPTLRHKKVTRYQCTSILIYRYNYAINIFFKYTSLLFFKSKI